jgi:hypothetical protein
MEIKYSEAKKKERLKEMQLGQILRDPQVIDYVLDLVAGVKAIFKFVSILNKQARIFQEAEIKLLRC